MPADIVGDARKQITVTLYEHMLVEIDQKARGLGITRGAAIALLLNRGLKDKLLDA